MKTPRPNPTINYTYVPGKVAEEKLAMAYKIIFDEVMKNRRLRKESIDQEKGAVIQI